MLNASKTCPWKCGGGQAGGGGSGGGGEVQHETNTGAPRVGLWDELHSKESECIFELSTFHCKFQECTVQMLTINKEPFRLMINMGGRYARGPHYCMRVINLTRKYFILNFRYNGSAHVRRPAEQSAPASTQFPSQAVAFCSLCWNRCEVVALYFLCWKRSGISME